MKKDVLGIKIDDINIDQAVEIVRGWLKAEVKHYIVTPNPEIVLMAQKDEQLKKIINNADLAVPDGNGLKIATDIECITPGIDLMEALIKMASENGFTVGLLGGMDRVAKQARERLLKKYPKLKVSFAYGDMEVNEEGVSSTIYHLPSTNLLFVAFGPSKQEKWVAKNLDKISVKVVMTVGGGLDYLSGQVIRAPIWMRKSGFEWLFRLIVQPWRIKRQLFLVKYVWLLTKSKQ